MSELPDTLSINSELNINGERYRVTSHEIIQPLWSDYGYLVRLRLSHAALPSVIVKSVRLPSLTDTLHPKGWNTAISHQRKLRSYQVEWNWYQNYVSQQPKGWVPQCLEASLNMVEGQMACENQLNLVLEDLQLSDCANTTQNPSQRHIELVITWLAHFHAYWLNASTEGLWERGTYWHLETRQAELQAMKPSRLKTAASEIARLLSHCHYQTIVHGDAKLANFCFDSDLSTVIAVDFQYVGCGIGVQDVVLFLSSVLDFDDPKLAITPWVNLYFQQLELALKQYHPDVDAQGVVNSWRSLIGVAWADFQRFLHGWSPTHWKINSFTEGLVNEALEHHRL